MYVILRQHHLLGEWLIVDWKAVWRRTPLELTTPEHDTTILAVQSAIRTGAAKVVAHCKRRDDARLLAREARRREQQYWLLRHQPLTPILSQS